MGRSALHRCLFLLVSAAALAVPAAGREKGRPWVSLSGDKGLEAWKEPHGEWLVADSVAMDPDNPKRLKAKPGKGGILVNGVKGQTPDLLSKEKFGDLELHCEFMIPKGSNSGVKFHAHYEIQIFDSFGKKKKLDGSDCGGIYPRAEFNPGYHHIDDGIAPKVNAARPAGEWQTLDVIFVAPRFDEAGKKVKNARIVKAVLNGQVIHDNVELLYPTGNNWKHKEMATGPLLLQGDHGPVAFRNFRVRPYKEK